MSCSRSPYLWTVKLTGLLPDTSYTYLVDNSLEAGTPPRHARERRMKKQCSLRVKNHRKYQQMCARLKVAIVITQFSRSDIIRERIMRPRMRHFTRCSSCHCLSARSEHVHWSHASPHQYVLNVMTIRKFHPLVFGSQLCCP